MTKLAQHSFIGGSRGG